jgi:hypothetical protein
MRRFLLGLGALSLTLVLGGTASAGYHDEHCRPVAPPVCERPVVNRVVCERPVVICPPRVQTRVIRQTCPPRVVHRPVVRYCR